MMTDMMNTQNAHRLTMRFRTIAILGVVASLLMLLYSVIVFSSDPVQKNLNGGRSPLETWPNREINTNLLLKKMAGRRLIRPSQVQAAVKDTGLADRLAKKLKLQGIVQMKGSYVAYIGVEKQGVKSLKEGEKILDFLVESIKGNEVVLSLDGVQVTLQH